MELTQKKFSYRLTSNLLLLLTIFGFVLLFNIPTITYGMIFYEQPPLYLANQQITSIVDLISIYLHPQMLYAGSIPFYRPSVHFLIYQLMTPILGWHNIQGFIIVNLFSLALCGLFFVKLYALLFPRLKVGGYLAFGIYLMQPALILPRLMSMQFDFIYVFFCLLSLYYFVLFCKKNLAFNHQLLQSRLYSPLSLSTLEFRHFNLLVSALVFYFIAVTCKETAVLLVFALASYLFISFYEKQPLLNYTRQLLTNVYVKQILALFALLSLTLFIYLYAQWMNDKFPLLMKKELQLLLFFQYLQYLFGFWPNNPNSLWTHTYVIYPMAARLMLWFFSFGLVAGLFLVFTHNTVNSIIFIYKKSIVFLFIFAVIFLLLPIHYTGWPWHISMTIVAVSLLMGFGFEYSASYLLGNKTYLWLFSIILLLLLGLTNIIVIHAHIDNQQDRTHFALLLNHNAVLNPPDIKNKLTADSVLLVRDSMNLSAYVLGDSYNPIDEITTYKKANNDYYLKLQPLYNSNLFRWAYLIPHLQEEVYSFTLTHLQSVPDEMIHHWMQHYKHIFSVSYDTNAIWHDETSAFKQNLRREQQRRHLFTHAYQAFPNHLIQGHGIAIKKISTPNALSCEVACDKNYQCGGFNLTYSTNHAICSFIHINSDKMMSACTSCASYIKQESV